jgi:hypothetical protein
MVGAIGFALLSAYAPLIAAQICAAGTFSASGSAPCANCPTGKYSPAGATACSDALVPNDISTSAAFARAVHAADLDGDGRVDVLSASMNDDKIAWYRNGGGSPVIWTTYTITTVADGALSVCAADVDGDGRFDVLSASENDDTIAWYKNGGGSPLVWTPYTITSSANGAYCVYAADVDSDGRVDVLSASSQDNTVAWYRNGGGTPVAWTPYIVSNAMVGVSVVHAADVDGDGKVDALSATGAEQKIAWYKNSGGVPAVWTPYTITTTASGVSSIFAVDLDGDGQVDVLSAITSDDTIAWYKNGGGTPVVWTPLTISTTADGPHKVFASDVDGDGRLDVLSASTLDDKIAWYRNGGGVPVVWTAHPVSTTADGAWSVYAADLDGDGRMDVLSASAHDNKIAWYRNLMCSRGSSGPGGFAPCTPCPTGHFGSASMLEVCEACPAGKYSVVGSSACTLCPSGRFSGTAAGLCSTMFVSHTIATTAVGAISVSAADLDSDGRTDVVSANREEGKIAWYKNGGGSPVTWTAYIISASALGAHSVYAADVDSDGRVDVLSASYLDDKVMWFKNGGSSPVVWTPYVVTTTADAPHTVHAADIDGDGRLDVLSASALDDKIAWYRNGGGSPVTWTPFTITLEADFAFSVHAADVNGDGRLDVVSASHDDDTITWCENGGGDPVVWTEYTITTSADGAMSVRAADVNNDGRVDVVSASFNDNTIAWYRNSGEEPIYWARYAITTAAGGPWSVYTADVDGDGWLDVLSADRDDDKITWYKSSGGSPVAWTPLVVTTTVNGPHSVRAADVDGDGRLDVLSASFFDNKVAWHLNVMCPRGTFGPEGFAPCSLCPPGRFGAAGFQSTCDAVCPAGTACPAGSAVTSVCPAGTYSAEGAAACTLCPSTAPFSPAASTNGGACLACASGCDGSYGRYPCADTSWALWYDSNGVETANRCVSAASRSCLPTPFSFCILTGRVRNRDATQGRHSLNQVVCCYCALLVCMLINLSCLKYASTAANWTVANLSCSTMGVGHHLLTARQVHACTPLPWFVQQNVACSRPGLALALP